MKKILIISIIILGVTTCFAQTFNKQRLDSLFQVLEKKDKFMGSIAVSQNGKILYTNAIGYSDIETSKKADVKTKYRIGSISKMFTASLIFKAIEEEKLSLNQTIDIYFPQIENSKKITIGNLLNHRSGIHNFTSTQDYLGYSHNPKSEEQMIEIIVNGKSDFEPNTKAEYSNSNYVLLSYILEKVYKKPYAVILETKIIKPLNLKNTYFGNKISIPNNESNSYKFNDKWDKEAETDMSIPMGAGAIVSNPTDLTIFIEHLFNGKIISEESLALMKTINENYGMGIFEYPYFDKKCYGHPGGIDAFQSFLNYLPEEKLSIAISSNGLMYSNNDVVLCALTCYFNTPFKLPTFNFVELKPEMLDLYLGQYASQQIPLKIAISRKENKLFGQATGQPEFPLMATATNTFIFEQAGLILEFDSTKKQMVLKQSGRDFMFTKE
nr:serine hydrolase domain-containing protein [uncultured Flavobacterium sp.]